MTYGPNATHFTGQMPVFHEERANAELISEPGPADDTADHIPELPKSGWQAVYEMARRSWPN